MFISLNEILSLAIISVILGYIFSGFIQRPRKEFEFGKKFDWEDIKFAMIIAAPAVILHEFGHKFVAIAFGLNAAFHIFWFGLLLGVIIKLLSFPLLFLAPAYVAIPAGATYLQSGIIAFAGPAVNLLLFGVSWLMLKHRKNMSLHERAIWIISKRLNLLLFAFNLIPIPPLDGYQVLEGLMNSF